MNQSPIVRYVPSRIEADGIVQGFGVVSADTIPEGRRVVPASQPVQRARGERRGRAMTRHLRIQHAELVVGYTVAVNDPHVDYRTVAAMQAACAATLTMADALDAHMDGDKAAFHAAMNSFVNDAFTSGAVRL